MEIRTISEPEAGAFLRLLCDVFALDFERASSVFFSEPLYDLRRKWGLFEGGQLLSILTTTPLSFGWGNAIGIAGVATREGHQRMGYAQKLLEVVLDTAANDLEGATVLFAHDTRLYERLGFVVLDHVVRAKLRPDYPVVHPKEIPAEDVRRAYDAWSSDHPSRLRRNDARWRFWGWGMRCCEPVEGGYICVEPSQVREAIMTPHRSSWPVVPGTDWFGLLSVVAELGIPIENPKEELILMARGFPEPPQMFMTDQF